ncbi:MAG: ATP synthase subunit I [Desulfovibrionaceae bacterium]|nr:ATP synthase subunit I [Desulfovibrionaceae bacterium]MBF0514639.1 ATP synthase subunit I [Desulfovibrionaceae bacterium]
MTSILRKTMAGLDGWLHRRGFAGREVRELMRAQICAAATSSALCLAVTGFGLWGLSFSVGAVLITVNFWSLAKFGQGVVFIRRGAVAALLFRFYLRLAATGVALFALIAYAGAPAAPLLAGVSTAVAAMVWWGMAKTMRTQVKEA